MAYSYTRSKATYSLFVHQSSSPITVWLVYVNDVILASNDLFEINRVKKLLDESFKIKDLGTLKFFIGQEIARSPQGKYIF